MGPGIIFAIAIGMLASGCDRKAEGQTVAVVNDEEITAAELNMELKNAQVPPGLAQTDARSRVLQSIVNRRLLAQQARSEGLDKSPEFVNRQRRMTEELLIQMLVARQVNTSELPSAQEIGKYESGRPQMFRARELWNLDQIQYVTPKDAAVVKRTASAKNMAELEQILTASGIAFKRGKGRIDTATIPDRMYGTLAKLPPGEPIIMPQGEQTVASVIVGREPAPVSGDEARSAAINLMRRDSVAKLIEQRVASLRQAAEIEYQPGYAPANK